MNNYNITEVKKAINKIKSSKNNLYHLVDINKDIKNIYIKLSSIENELLKYKNNNKQENYKMYIFKDNLTIEIIKHNNHVIIKDENCNKNTFIGYSIKQAIKQFKKQYKQKGIK